MVEPTVLVQQCTRLPIHSQLDVLSKLFSSYITSEMRLSVPDDFIILAARAMLQLKNSGRSNVLYNLAKAIGTPREDGSDSRFPTKRMPMGLVEYISSFFVAENLQSVSYKNNTMQKIFHFALDILSYGLSCLATDDVQSLWPQMVTST